MGSRTVDRMTIATLFSGGEGVGLGARAAGLRHLWGIEVDDRIAAVARHNGFHVITADVRDVDPFSLEGPDVLHASPECKSASVATSGGELEHDREMAAHVVRFLEVLKPRVFTLENVYPYRNFEAFKSILAVLGRLGYFYHFDNLNAADFGVAQTRRRLILRAVRGGLLPLLPTPQSWVGWDTVTRDLWPRLPDAQFARWQVKRLPEAIRRSLLFSNQNSHDREGNCYGTVYREAGQPAMTVRQAMLWARAFLVGGANTSDAQARPGLGISMSGEPSRAVNATNAVYWRAWLAQGRVVQMTPRALARFQTFPDWYELPESKTLASRIVGNAVPPLMYQKIIAQLISIHNGN